MLWCEPSAPFHLCLLCYCYLVYCISILSSFFCFFFFVISATYLCFFFARSVNHRRRSCRCRRAFGSVCWFCSSSIFPTSYAHQRSSRRAAAGTTTTTREAIVVIQLPLSVNFKGFNAYLSHGSRRIWSSVKRVVVKHKKLSCKHMKFM